MGSEMCIRDSYTTPPRIQERANYKSHREIAMVMCISQFLKCKQSNFALEYIFNSIHIVLNATFVGTLIRLEIYDCYDKVKGYAESDYVQICDDFMFSEESRLEDYMPFAISYNLQGVHYAIIAKMDCHITYLILNPQLCNWDLKLENTCRACINSGVAGIAYTIDLQSLGL